MITLGLCFAALAGCSVLESADRGLYSLANAVSHKDNITGRREISFANRQQQIAQGKSYRKKILAKYTKEKKPINAEFNTKAYARLLRVFTRIHAISHYRDESWDVYLLPDKSFNAFVVGGAEMFVYHGLLDALNDDELAAVIGHEIAHITANHVSERSGHQMAALLSGSDSIKTNNFQKAFTHEFEEEADKIGILYAALAGYDPYAASRVWKARYNKSGDQAGFVRDHPIYSERIANTQAIAKKVKPYYKKGKQNPQFASLLTKNALWNSEHAQATKAGEGGGIASVLETALTMVTKHQQAKAEAKRQNNRAATIAYVSKHLKVSKLKRTSSTTITTAIYYTGEAILNTLTLRLNDDNHSAITTVDGPIHPRKTYDVPFNSKTINVKKATMAVDNAS